MKRLGTSFKFPTAKIKPKPKPKPKPPTPACFQDAEDVDSQPVVTAAATDASVEEVGLPLPPPPSSSSHYFVKFFSVVLLECRAGCRVTQWVIDSPCTHTHPLFLLLPFSLYLSECTCVLRCVCVCVNVLFLFLFLSS